MHKIISVVLPCFNESKNIPLIYEKLLNSFEGLPYSYEIIFVNDGSADNTWQTICAICSKDKKVSGINFSRNFGHHAALQAGLESASGDAVIMMDADMQHPTSMIPKLLHEWEAGNEIVNTIRLSTERTTFFKKYSGKLFYKLINSISDLNLNDGEADFRLVGRRALDILNELPESPKFYRGLVNWIGFRTARLEYHAVARRFGKSSYSLKKMLELARLGLTSFSLKPLKFIIGFGVTLSTTSLFVLLIMLGVKFFVNPLYFSSTAILVMFLIFVAGMLSTFQGIIAVYMVDIFNAAKGRPTFIVDSRTHESRKGRSS